MKIGTKSVLFGAHCFLFHGFFVALGWWKLWGFSRVKVGPAWQRNAYTSLWHPWLWIAFFVHDIGYIGKPNMDGSEGEQHPWTGANILYWLQGAWLYLTGYAWRDARTSWWEQRRRWCGAHLAVGRQPVVWGNEALYHSRFLAKQYGATPSRLCVADKLASALTPRWLYLPLVRATGEIKEYMALSHHNNATGGKYASMNLTTDDELQWHADFVAYVRRWVDEHKDGREDTWTPNVRRAASPSGVWE